MKIIGIVGRRFYNKDNQEIIQLNEYIRKVLDTYDDICPIILIPTNKGIEKIKFLLSLCDGFIVPGGTNWYDFDEYVIKYAIDNKKPLLSICLGFQCLCSMFAYDRVEFDMTKRLNNDIHYKEPEKYAHSICLKKDTLLYKILKKETIKVNSIHHDYIDFPMKELIVSAISTDNIIEAVEYPNHPFLIGLQWHPEYLYDNNSKKIFNYFIKSL